MKFGIKRKTLNTLFTMWNASIVVQKSYTLPTHRQAANEKGKTRRNLDISMHSASVDMSMFGVQLSRIHSQWMGRRTEHSWMISWIGRELYFNWETTNVGIRVRSNFSPYWEQISVKLPLKFEKHFIHSTRTTERSVNINYRIAYNVTARAVHAKISNKHENMRREKQNKTHKKRNLKFVVKVDHHHYRLVCKWYKLHYSLRLVSPQMVGSSNSRHLSKWSTVGRLLTVDLKLHVKRKRK